MRANGSMQKKALHPRGEARTTRRTVISRPVVSTAVSNCFVTLKRICAVPLTSKQSRQDSTADTCCPVTTCAITAHVNNACQRLAEHMRHERCASACKSAAMLYNFVHAQGIQ